MVKFYIFIYMIKARRRSKFYQNKVAYVDENEDEADILGIYSVFKASEKQPIMVNVTLHKIVLPMQVDTGAAVSVISIDPYKKGTEQIQN